MFVAKYNTIYKFIDAFIIFVFQLYLSSMLSIVLEYGKSTLNTFIHKGKFSNIYTFLDKFITQTTFLNTCNFCKILLY